MNTGMARRGFGNDEPPVILECINRLYGLRSLQELDQARLRLRYQMYHNQLVKVMLRTTEEVQIFLMAHPDGDLEQGTVNMQATQTKK